MAKKTDPLTMTVGTTTPFPHSWTMGPNQRLTRAPEIELLGGDNVPPGTKATLDASASSKAGDSGQVKATVDWASGIPGVPVSFNVIWHYETIGESGSTDASSGTPGDLFTPDFPAIDLPPLERILSLLFPKGVLASVGEGFQDFAKQYENVTAELDWIGLQYNVPVVPVILGFNNEVSIDVSEAIEDVDGCCPADGVKADMDWIGIQNQLPVVPIVLGNGNKVSIKGTRQLATERDMSADRKK